MPETVVPLDPAGVQGNVSTSLFQAEMISARCDRPPWCLNIRRKKVVSS